MTETTSADLRTAAWLLLIGGIVFLVGAFSPPSEQWTSPLKRSLQVIGEHRAAWYWIHACFVVGVVLTMLGFVAFAGARNRSGSGSTLTDLVTALYVVGAGFWLVSITFRVTVQVWAASEVVATGAIPATYESWHKFSSALFMLYMIMAYLACAGIGWEVLRAGMVAKWAGWFAIAFGLSGGAVVGRNVPLMVHIPLIIIAILLLRH
jgi:hypothetical protein